MSEAAALPTAAPVKPKGEDGTSALREAENSAIGGEQDGFYTGSGRDSSGTGKQTGFITGGRIKQFVASTIAIGIVSAIMFLLNSTNLMLAPMFIDNITDATSTQDISGKSRETIIMRHMLKSQNKKGQKNWEGLKKYDTIPEKTLKRFALYGIEVDKSGGDTRLKFNDTIIDDSNFVGMFRGDKDFREAFQKANRSNIRNFFDSPADFFFKRIGNARNWLKNYREGPDEEENKKKRNDILSEKFDGNTTDTENSAKMEETDEDGNTTEVDETTGEASSKSEKTSKADAEAKARSHIANLADNVTNVLDAGCAMMRIGSAIAATVAAVDTINTIKYFLGDAESMSKMMAGEGSTSAINETLNFFTTPADAETPATSGIEGDTIKTYGAPIEASGLQVQISNAKTTPESTEPYSFERSGNALLKAMALNGYSNDACAALTGVTSAVSIATTIASLGTVKVVSYIITSTVGNAVVNLGITATLGFFIPILTQSLYSNIFDDLVGIPAGHTVAGGAAASNMMLSRNGSAQMPSTKKKVLKFAEVQNTVLALDAEIDRKNLSPFDISSKNTFLGSIVNSLLPTMMSTRANSVTALTNSTSKALASITGTSTYAANGENDTYITTFGKCNKLQEINAEGDLYCYPISTTDPATIQMEVDDDNYVDKVASQMESCDENGNCVIEENSELDKFIKYCEYRESPFGFLDSNILDDLNASANKVVDFLSNLPILDDVISIIDAGLDVANEKWATGEKCVVSDESDWSNEMAYYQRYVEDQRILEQLGAYPEGESPVQQAYNRYIEKNPLYQDNSDAGTLARISGLRKDDAQLVLDIAEYYNFIQNYDPSTRIAMTGDTTTLKTSDEVAIAAQSETQPLFDISEAANQVAQVVAILRPTVVYADLRTRSYVV